MGLERTPQQRLCLRAGQSFCVVVLSEVRKAQPKDLLFVRAGRIVPLQANRRSFDSGDEKHAASAQDDNSEEEALSTQH